mmetsp:Transcript_136619/g.291824  ORF Transcript_136619/g.291824 Transcript_136619/m.291824 type:complete len:238 (-) Transcript_136619:726-1439(-)
MDPRRQPQHWLRNPILTPVDPFQLLAAIKAHLGVLQPAFDDDVHVRRVLSGVEQIVIGGQHLGADRGQGQAVHGDTGRVAQAVEEGMDLEVLHRNLTLELALELFGKQVEDFDVLNRQVILLTLPSMLQILDNAATERDGHLLLLQVAPEVPERLGGIFLHAAELRQGPRNAAHHVGEANQPADNNRDREHALPLVVRLNVHACRRELRNAPVKARRILVPPIRVGEAMLRDPGGSI